MLLFGFHSTVHTVIKELQDEAANPGSLLNSRGASRKQELMLLMKNLEEALKELDGIVTKYQGLTRRERRIWIQLKLATENLDTVRSKLTFHVTAINAFTSSLSRETLVQIETALIELISEVRLGRRQPSLTSLHEENNDSVWRELESELAEDGISSTDIVKHKAAIKVFVHNLLTHPDADTTSFVEVASLMESSNDEPVSESLSQSRCVMDVPPGECAELLSMGNAQNGLLASVDDEKYESVDEESGSGDDECESADEELPPEDAGISTDHSTVDHASKYAAQLRTHFVLQPKAYRQFYGVLKSWKEGFLDRHDAIDWSCALLVRFPELLQGLNTLSSSLRFECGTVDNRCAFRVITPFTAYIRIPDLQALQSPVVEGRYLHSGQLKWIDPASLNILRPYPKMAVPLDWARDQPASRASGVIEARNMFASRFKTLLARMKVTKEAASDRSRSDKMNGTIQVRNRLGLSMSSRRAF